MKVIKTISMTEEQKKRYEGMKEDMHNAETAYYMAGENAVRAFKRFWKEINEIFSLPKDAKPVINWKNYDITYLDEE